MAAALLGPSFREAFLPGLFATAIGVILALPFGLFIAQRQLAAAADEAETGDRERLGHLLDVLEEDLRSTLTELTGRMDTHQAHGLVPFLQSNLWAALVASGDVARASGRPELLQALTNAYYRIETTAYLERRLYELWSSQPTHPPIALPVELSPAKPDLRRAEGVLVDQDRHTKAAIDVALQRISEARERA